MKRSLNQSSLQDLLTRPLWEISIQELSTRSLHRTPYETSLYKIPWYPWTSQVSSQELSTRSLHKTSMRDLYTRALYKIPSQDLYERSLYKSSLQDLFTRPLWEISSQELSTDLFTRPLWEISIRELSTRSLHKTSMRDLYTRALYKTSSQDPIWDISIQDLLISLDFLGLLTGALYKISSQDLYDGSLYKSSLQDLFTGPHMRHLYTRSPDIPGLSRSPHRSSLQDLFTRPPCEISIQDRLISLDLLGLFTRALYRISSQDLYERSLYKSSLQDLLTRPLWGHLYTRAPQIPGLPRSPHRSSLQDPVTSPIWNISIQDLLTSLDLLGLFTGALYKISSQDLYERSLYKSSLQDLFTRPLWEISIHELSTRSLHKTSMRDLFRRALCKISSQDLYERSLYKSSLQDLFRRPLWDISIQDLRISLDLLGLFTGVLYKISSHDLYERSLYKISWYPWTSEIFSLQDLFKRPRPGSNTQKVPRGLRGRALCKISSQDLYERSLYRSSLQDLFTRPLWDISLQDLRISLDLLGLFTGALYKIFSQDLYERSLYKISWYPWTSEIFSLQDLFKRPRSGSNTQKVPRGLRGQNQNRHRATARAIRHARTPQRVARAETKNAPGWAPATFHQQNEHGATARAIRRAQSPERVAFANIKSAPRHSETQKTRVPTAPWRQNYNTKCDFSMFCDASTAPATKKWVRGIRSPVTATRNDVNIADPNSTTVSQNEHFELSKTDFKSTKYCACHEKWRFFTTSNFEQPLRRFCTPLKTLTFCTFPDFRKSTRRAGENAPPKWTSSGPRFAQAKCKCSISRELFLGKGRQICRTRIRTPPIYTRCFSITVRTP